MKDIFNPDSYTAEAMPLTTELCCVLDTGDLGKTSSALRECKEKHKELNNKFFNSLTKEQQELYNEIQWADIEETALELREYFNRGMRFGAVLMKELFD